MQAFRASPLFESHLASASECCSAVIVDAPVGVEESVSDVELTPCPPASGLAAQSATTISSDKFDRFISSSFLVLFRVVPLIELVHEASRASSWVDHPPVASPRITTVDADHVPHNDRERLSAEFRKEHRMRVRRR